MPSLISQSDIIEFNKVFADLHDTFKRTILVFKESKKNVIATNPEYNHLYKQRFSRNDIGTMPVSGEVDVRIYYLPRQGTKPSSLTSQDQFNLDISDADVRLKIDKNDFHLFEGAERYEIDGAIFTNDSKNRPHGFLDINYETLFLKRID